MHETPAEPLEALQSQLRDAAEEFAGDDDLPGLMETMSADVERASTADLEVVPVAHHSPSSAVHVARRLREADPEVVYLELPEDLQGAVEDLTECTLPVALQAFANESEAFPAEWTPLTVVAPLTEFSAEAQVIGYAMGSDTELRFVDRSVDHVFQSIPDEDPIEDHTGGDGDGSGSGSGSADDDGQGTPDATLGVRIGEVEPTFEAFRRFLLRNARVRHWTEWWNQYVEQAVVTGDYETYRHAMLLVGTLLRRIGRREDDREDDRFRERYMWRQIHDHLADAGVDPDEAMYVCGAVHAVSPVDAYGLDADPDFEVPDRTDTDWQYGLVPSSYREIDRQFGHPPGTIKRNEGTWRKARRSMDVPSHWFDGDGGGGDDGGTGGSGSGTGSDDTEDPDPRQRLLAAGEETEDFLARPPELAEEDDDELLEWCIDVVDAAQDEGYPASTADAIAVFEHAKLLATMRNRPHPTPYDFREAAVTCIEKTESPAREDVATLCDRLLGGDRRGQVGYTTLPPLAQDVYDRLDRLPIDPQSRTIERALLDYRENPEYREPADLLARLDFLLEDADVVRPIMARRELGHEPTEESWDVLTGKNQRPLIELGYQGVTVEQVLEMRLKERAYGEDADAVSALEATKDSIVYLDGPRLTRELGERATELLTEETGADNAGAIFERARELVQHFRSTPEGVPDWLEAFVGEGYSHYARLLPGLFDDGDTAPADIADVLGFVFTLESLALSVGRDRSELEIAVGQAAGVDTTPDKVGLLWTAEWLLDRRSKAEIRAFFDRAFEKTVMAPQIPAYLTGFVHATRFARQVTPLVVELMTEAFGRLPDGVLLPWLPDLLVMLESTGEELVPELVREAGRTFPETLAALDEWEPDWVAERAAGSGDGAGEAGADAAPAVDLSERERSVAGLVYEHRGAAAAASSALGAGSGGDGGTGDGDGDGAGDAGGEWVPVHEAPAGGPAMPPALADDDRARTARETLFDHRETATAVAASLGLVDGAGDGSVGDGGGGDGGEWTRELGAPAGGGGPLAGLDARERAVRELLDDHRGAAGAVAAGLGAGGPWADIAGGVGVGPGAGGGGSGSPVGELLADHDGTLRSVPDPG